MSQNSVIWACKPFASSRLVRLHYGHAHKMRHRILALLKLASKAIK